MCVCDAGGGGVVVREVDQHHVVDAGLRGTRGGGAPVGDVDDRAADFGDAAIAGLAPGVGDVALEQAVGDARLLQHGAHEDMVLGLNLDQIDIVGVSIGWKFKVRCNKEGQNAGGRIDLEPALIGTAQPIHVLTPGVTARGILNLTAIAAAEVAREG